MKIGSTDIVNCKIGSTQVNEIRIGSTLVWQFSSVDPDAQAFITAAAITNPTQQTAINTLVVSLKADGIWTKMSAIYPFVGGTAASHKYNLKDPRDLDAAYRIFWNGGITHSSNGVLPSGTNGWGNTYFSFNSSTALSSHISTYLRTNSTTLACEFGSGNSAGTEECFIVRNGSTFLNNQCNAQTGRLNPSVADSRGLILNSRTANNNWKTYKNGISLATGTLINTYTGGSVYILNLFRRGGAGTNDLYSAKECAFASIGDGLTDTDSSNLYTAVQSFNTALGRSVGPQTVSDADAQAFVTAANIQDQVQADAVNNLVIGLKADGLWTKMKAIYPFVGGDATSHKWNLKNTAQYQITWFGGVTHNANGITGNGSNAYGDTFLNNNVLGQNDNHLSVYVRSSSGVGNDLSSYNGSTFGCSMYTNLLGGFTGANNIAGGYFTFVQPTLGGLYINRRISSTQYVLQRNLLKQTNTATTTNHITTSFKLLRTGNANAEYSNKNLALASLGDSLNNTEADNFYTRVQAFQTALSRQV